MVCRMASRSLCSLTVASVSAPTIHCTRSLGAFQPSLLYSKSLSCATAHQCTRQSVIAGGSEKGIWRLPFGGIYNTAVGYAAGYTPNPTYEECCSGMSGHTEAVRVVYNPAKISFVDILRWFWESRKCLLARRDCTNAACCLGSPCAAALPGALRRDLCWLAPAAQTTRPVAWDRVTIVAPSTAPASTGSTRSKRNSSSRAR